MKRFKFNRNVYSDKAIEAAILAFKNHATMLVSYKKKYAIVSFIQCRYDETQTVKEFENYMIGVENT